MYNFTGDKCGVLTTKTNGVNHGHWLYLYGRVLLAETHCFTSHLIIHCVNRRHLTAVGGCDIIEQETTLSVEYFAGACNSTCDDTNVHTATLIALYQEISVVRDQWETSTTTLCSLH